MAGIQRNVGMNAKAELNQIKKFKATKKVWDRISALHAEWKTQVTTHFDEALNRTISCYGGNCCKRNGQPNVYFRVPIIKYRTNDRAELIPGSFPEIEMLNLSYTKNEQFVDKNDYLILSGKNEGKIKNVSTEDLIVMGGEEKTFNGKTFVEYTLESGGPAIWRTKQEWKQELKEKWLFYKEHEVSDIVELDNEQEYFTMLAQSKSNKEKDNKSLPQNTQPNQQQLPPAQNNVVDDFDITNIDTPIESAQIQEFNPASNANVSVDAQNNTTDDDFSIFDE